MIYWLALMLIIGITVFIKKDSKFYLLAAFYIFCVGALLVITGLAEIAELILRISFIGWTIGLVKAFKEFN